jgi:hypothetical protein
LLILSLGAKEFKHNLIINLFMYKNLNTVYIKKQVVE